MISLAVWLVEGGKGVPFETIAIVTIVLFNAVLGQIQGEKAEAAVAALERMTTTTVAVVRSGRQRRLSNKLTGDIVRKATRSRQAPDFSMSPRYRSQRPLRARAIR